MISISLKVILIQILLVTTSLERRIEDSPQPSHPLEENSSNFRYNADLKTESENQNDLIVNKNIRIEKRSVSVDLSSVGSTGSPAFKVLRKNDTNTLSLKSKRNGTQTRPTSQSYDKLKSAISEFPPDFMSEEVSHSYFTFNSFPFF